jgi:hypothetical protein
MNKMSHELLGEIFCEHPALFQADMKSISNMEDKCSVRCLFPRGSHSLAIAMKVPAEDIKVVQWMVKEGGIWREQADVHGPFAFFCAAARWSHVKWMLSPVCAQGVSLL